MDWLNDILTLGASATTGGVFGLIGSIGGQVSKYFQERQRQNWEREKWSRDERMFQLQMESDAQASKLRLEEARQTGSWNGLKASIDSQSNAESYKWVTAVRSLFRPVITLCLWVLAAWVFHCVVNMTADLITQEEKNSLIIYMICSIFFTACTATAWWFGDRALTPPDLKGK